MHRHFATSTGGVANPRPVVSECVCDWLHNATGLDCGDRSWICNAPQDIVEECLKVTKTGVLLNAMMAPQGHMITVYHITNIFYKYRRCTKFVRVSQTQTTTF